MKALSALKLALVVVLVVSALLSGLYVRQAWADSHAQSQADSAHAKVLSTIARARSIGLTDVELAPYVRKVQRLEHMRAPAPSPFWGTDLPNFLNRLTHRYGGLQKALRREIQGVTAASREAASRDVDLARQEISHATSLNVGTREMAAVVAHQQQRFSAASEPREYRAISAALTAPLARLTSTVSARQQYVNGVLKQANNDLPSVVQIASDEVTAAQDQLGLLGLLTPRAASYGTTIERDMAAERSAPSAFAAAVRESQLHHDLAVLQADYFKTIPGKMIVVSTENQSATMYENGKQVYSTPVTTGGPELPTDHGVFQIYLKVSPFVFHSPWPEGSPYYYPPTPIQYWMPFDGAEGLHDASWRSNFGPGSNFAPTDLGTGNYILGTHGCVNLPFAAAQFVWDWAPVGTTVVVT